MFSNIGEELKVSKAKHEKMTIPHKVAREAGFEKYMGNYKSFRAEKYNDKPFHIVP
jgi:hypothetical protein